MGLIIIICLLVFSALISGSEVAYFSLSPANIQYLKDKKKSRKCKMVLELLAKPERLLATILIANNFVNVGIVILAAFVTNELFDFSVSPVLGFIIQAVVITFIILLFGEIIPKVYAARFSRQFATFMAFPLFLLDRLFMPVSKLLIRSTSIVRKRYSGKRANISMDDLSQALNIAGKELKDEEKILKGIVNFGTIDVTEIMTSRLDVVSIEYSAGFKKLLSVILESGYSRIPVYEDSFDDVRGILYIKDLLPYLDEDDYFSWQKLVREPYFVPETKKIDDLLGEFQTKKIHLAIIVNEYGGTQGIVTLEDILEEIVGEINDESDDIEENYLQMTENKYIFEGRTLLNDFCKIVNIEDDLFDEVRGDADTLAGLILELKAEIPKKHEVVKYRNFIFRIKSADQRRIKQIEVTINPLKSTKN
ncbi:MAG: gliding motility-associated protein GldE [Bacteroidetes bacterium]|nr:gliding motility-associated protein GldE [Bacteroidota bacterium]